MAQTYVVGGFARESSGDPEVEWLVSKIKNLNVDPESVYFKGDEFKGLLFAKFHSAEIARKTMETIGKSKPNFSDKEIWFKQESPVEVRAVRNFLLGLRWQLGEWDSTKKPIKVDVRAFTMTVEKRCRERGSGGRYDEDYLA